MLQIQEDYIVELVMNNQTEEVKSLLNKIYQENNNKTVLEVLRKEIESGHTLLLIALKNNNEELAKILINYGSNINTQCNHEKGGYTPLHIALEYFMPNLTDFLLDQYSINVNLINFEGNLPLHIASHFYKNIIKESQISETRLLYIIEKLIHFTTNINQRNYKGLTALQISIEANNVNLCKLLLKNGADVNLCCQDRYPYVIFAIKKGLTQIVKILLEHLYKQNITIPKDGANNNLLHIAVAYDNIEIIEEILKYGDKIGINERNDASLTPLAEALVNEKIEIAKYLIRKNADIVNTEMATIPCGKSYLHHAIKSIPDQELIKLLVVSSSNLNYQAIKNKHTALHLSIIHNSHETFQLLLDNNADPSIQDSQGKTVLHYAIEEKKHVKYIKTLLKREEKLFYQNTFKEPLINIKNNSHDTVLHIATTHYSTLEIFHLLLNFPGININARNEIGLTALHIAISNNNNRLANLLIDHKADISIKDSYMRNSFHRAVMANNLFMIKKLIKMCMKTQTEDVLNLKSDLFSTNSSALRAIDLKDGTSAITKLAISNAWKEIKFLNQHSFEFQEENSQNIFWIAGKDLTRIGVEKTFIKFIKEFPYLIQYKDEQNLTLVHHFICNTGNFSILNNIDRDLYAKTLKDSRLFSHLVQYNKRESITFLLKNHYVENNDGKEESPLFTSLKFNKDLLQFLLTHRFNPNVQNSNGNTPLHLATQENDMQSIKMLLSFTAKPDIKNHKEETPLFYAVNNLKILEVLLERNTIIHIKNKAGFTPLSKAAKDLENNRDIVITLLHKAYTTNQLNELMINSLEKINYKDLIHILNILVVHGRTLSEIVDKNGRNILHNIAISNHFKTLELIIHQQLIDINAVDNNNDTALNLSIKYAKKNSNKSIKLLIENDASIEIKNKEGIEPLINAVLHERHDITEMLLFKKFGKIKIQTFINYIKKSGYSNITDILERLKLSKLSIAISCKDYNSFYNLINDKSLNINQKDILHEYSPLHYAVIYNFLNGVKALLNEGGAINQLDKNKRTPIFYAVITRNLDITKLLLSQGAHIYQRDIDSKSLLDHAVKNNFLEGIKLLKQQSDDIDSTLDKNLKYSLHRAIEHKAVDLMIAILSKPIDHLQYKCCLVPPIHYAVINDFSEGINVLIKHSQDINEDVNTMFRDKTPIMYAARSLNLKIFEQLLPHGCLSIKNSEGLTASDILMNSLLSEMFFIHLKKNISEEDYILCELPKIKIDVTERGTQQLLEKIKKIWQTLKRNDCKLSTYINFSFLTENLHDLQKILNTIISLQERLLVYQDLKNLALLSPSMECLFQNIIQQELMKSYILTKHFTKQEIYYTETINRKLATKDSLPLLYTFEKKTATHSDPAQEFIDQEIKTTIIDKGNPLLDHTHMITLLHCAAMLNNTAIVELIATESNINKKTMRNFTPLFYGILCGGTNNKEVIQKILSLNANINDTIGCSITAIHCTSLINNTEITKLLIEHNADINAKSDLGYTTLMLSIQYSNKKNIEYLLSQKNIDITITNLYGNNALLLAIEKNDLHTTKLLLEKQFVNINHKNVEGISAIIMATMTNNLELIRILFTSTKEFIEVNVQDNYKRSPLFYAILNSNTELVKLLLEKGASVNMLDKKGMSSLELCMKLNNKELFNIILETRTTEIVTQCETGIINIENNNHMRSYSNPYFKEKLLKVLNTKKLSSELHDNPTVSLIKIFNATRKM